MSANVKRAGSSGALAPVEQAGEQGELPAGVGQAVREDGDGISLAVHLDVQPHAVAVDLRHERHPPDP
jgi:hypothetical protein